MYHAVEPLLYSDGAVSTLVESWQADVVGNVARLNHSHGIIMDADGTICVTDCHNYCALQVAP